jgi:hypothetical protein
MGTKGCTGTENDGGFPLNIDKLEVKNGILLPSGLLFNHSVQVAFETGLFHGASAYSLDRFPRLPLRNVFRRSHKDGTGRTGGFAGRLLSVLQSVKAEIAKDQLSLRAKTRGTEGAHPQAEFAAYASVPVDKGDMGKGVFEDGGCRADPETGRILAVHAGDGHKRLVHPIPVDHRPEPIDVDQVEARRLRIGRGTWMGG